MADSQQYYTQNDPFYQQIYRQYSGLNDTSLNVEHFHYHYQPRNNDMRAIGYGNNYNPTHNNLINIRLKLSGQSDFDAQYVSIYDGMPIQELSIIIRRTFGIPSDYYIIGVCLPVSIIQTRNAHLNRMQRQQQQQAQQQQRRSHYQQRSMSNDLLSPRSSPRGKGGASPTVRTQSTVTASTARRNTRSTRSTRNSRAANNRRGNVSDLHDPSSSNDENSDNSNNNNNNENDNSNNDNPNRNFRSILSDHGFEDDNSIIEDNTTTTVVPLSYLCCNPLLFRDVNVPLTVILDHPIPILGYQLWISYCRENWQALILFLSFLIVFIFIIDVFSLYPWHLLFWMWHNVINPWSKHIYRYGPYIPLPGMSIGFWQGKDLPDICSYWSSQSADFWARNMDECNIMYEKAEYAFCASVAVILAALLLFKYVGTMTYVLWETTLECCRVTNSGAKQNRQRRRSR